MLESIVQEYLIKQWEFFAMALIFWVIGHFMEKSVFTKPRAYAKGHFQWFWWWGRESMELHPIIAGALLGLAYKGWLYFAAAGAVSLFFWKIVSAYLKRKYGDANIRMPGESDPPKP